MSASDYPRLHAKTTAEWRRWLRDNHDKAQGVWLVAFKAATGKTRLTYEDSIPDALSYGWIDSLNKPLDDERTALLFTPRKPGSGWSRTNKVRISRLLKEGRIRVLAALALRYHHQDAKPAIPALINLLRSKDLEARRAAIQAFTGIGPIAKDAIPALVQVLKGEPNVDMQMEVFMALMRDGSDRDEPADGNRGLPHSQREAALGGREPVHDRAPAGRVDAGARGSGDPQQEEEPPEATGVRGTGERRSAGAEPGGQHEPLTRPVGEQPPRQKRQQAADPDAVEHEADLDEAEPELVPDLRCQHGQSDEHRRVRGLRRRPRREDEPAVPRRRGYSPNGLNGFGLVETITLFVSR